MMLMLFIEMMMIMTMRRMMSMRNEDGYDDDACRLSLPATSLCCSHQVLKLIGVETQEASSGAVVNDDEHNDGDDDDYDDDDIC